MSNDNTTIGQPFDSGSVAAYMAPGLMDQVLPTPYLPQNHPQYSPDTITPGDLLTADWSTRDPIVRVGEDCIALVLPAPLVTRWFIFDLAGKIIDHGAHKYEGEAVKACYEAMEE